jgi:hypothetical protein
MGQLGVKAILFIGKKGQGGLKKEIESVQGEHMASQTRRKKRAEESRLRNTKVKPARLKAHVRRTVILRPLALLVALASVAGAGFFLHNPMGSLSILLFGTMVAGVMYLTTDYRCPICRADLELEGNYGFFRTPDQTRCKKCGVQI